MGGMCWPAADREMSLRICRTQACMRAWADGWHAAPSTSAYFSAHFGTYRRGQGNGHRRHWRTHNGRGMGVQTTLTDSLHEA